MIKLNKIAYDRLISQAEEAKELKLNELADSLLNALGPIPRDDRDNIIFSYDDLKKDIHQSLWKIALNIVAYHDTIHVDAEQVNETLSDLTDKVLQNIEQSLNVENQIGPFEPSLPGEIK
jgi:hypothetical protein